MWTTSKRLTIISSIQSPTLSPEPAGRPVGGSRGCGWMVEGRGGWWPSVAVCLCAVNLAPQCYIYVRSSPASTRLSSTVTFTADLQHEAQRADSLLPTHVRRQFERRQWPFASKEIFCQFMPCWIYCKHKQLGGKGPVMVIKAGCSRVYLNVHHSCSISKLMDSFGFLCSLRSFRRI